MNKLIKYGCLLLITVVMSVNGFGQKSKPYKYSPKEIKSVFMYSFLKYVNWPKESLKGDDLIIGFLGENPFTPSIQRIIENRTINGKNLVIKKFDTIEEGAYYAHVLYINSSLEGRIWQILKALKDLPVLTISEMPGFCEKGGVINFSKAKIKYGFEVNLKAAHKAKLEMSSKLVGLATKKIE